jgi:CBS domain-containing protein
MCNFRDLIIFEEEGDMAGLKEILARKTGPTATVTPDESAITAIGMMAAKNMGSVLVMEGEKLVGILSERDLVLKLLAVGKNPKDVAVSEIMTAHPYCATISQSVESCISLMSERRFRHLPVIDNDKKVVGVVSMGDLVKSLITEQAFMIDQFERYVYSGGF